MGHIWNMPRGSAGLRINDLCGAHIGCLSQELPLIPAVHLASIIILSVIMAGMRGQTLSLIDSYPPNGRLVWEYCTVVPHRVDSAIQYKSISGRTFCESIAG